MINRRSACGFFLERTRSMIRPHSFQAFSVLLLCSLISFNANADEFGDIKILKTLPLSETEIKTAFMAAKVDSCEQVGEGQPLELTNFTPFLTARDKQTTSRRPMAATRRGFLSIGLQVEEAGLPTLSKSKILDYVDKNYVSLQARIRRDLLDRKLYYHHRPIAVTAQFTGSKLTKAFEPVVAQTTNTVRSLGVFAEPDKRPLKAEHLRTIVLVFRYEKAARAGRIGEDYELAIVRGKESADGQSLVPHVFVTLDNRTRLAYLRQFNHPKQLTGCSISAKVLITDFDSTTGLYPKKTVTQSYSVSSRIEYDRSKLEDYCQKTLDGTMATHINQLLDDIIEDKVPKPTAR